VNDVLYSAAGGVGTVTLNRPGKLNALTDDMLRSVRAALEEIDEDENVRVGVLTGAGRAFCSGADVAQRQLRPLEEIVRYGGPGAKGARTSELMLGLSHWKPMVVAVHGYVMGAGLHIALSCDVIVAAEETKFHITEVTRGVDGSGTWALLADLYGVAGFATETALTGRYWTSEEACNLGIVGRLVKSEDLYDETQSVAEVIAAMPPQAVKAIVRRRRLRLEAIELETRSHLQPDIYQSADFRESAMAFIEKRAARPFRGE